MQHCTDETIDKEMNNMVSPIAKQICSKSRISGKTATGYAADSVCGVGRRVSIASHSDIAGELQFRLYGHDHLAQAIAGSKGAAARYRDQDRGENGSGACKPDQKPGDIVMPGGGFKDQRQGRRISSRL